MLRSDTTSLMFLFTGILTAQEFPPPTFERIDPTSRIIVREILNFDNPTLECISQLMLEQQKGRKSNIKTLRDQMIQNRVAAKEAWGTIHVDRITLIGSKALPNLLTVVYLVNSDISMVPVSITWERQGDVFMVAGVNYGSGANQDLSDLTQKFPGTISEFVFPSQPVVVPKPGDSPF